MCQHDDLDFEMSKSDMWISGVCIFLILALIIGVGVFVGHVIWGPCCEI